MIAQKMPLTPWTEGDAWEGVPAILITTGPDGGPYTAPDSPLTLVTMRFKKIGDASAPIVELSSAAAGEITIVSAATWEISLPRQIIPGLTAGRWLWQIRCTDSSANGNPQTYLEDIAYIRETV